MKILFCGDVVGRSGRNAILKHIPELRKSLNLDFIVVNGENAAAGFGITASICDDFFKVGVDVITTGNHIFDKRDIVSYLDRTPRLLRPINYPSKTPGSGKGIYTLSDGRKVMVINVMTRLFMEPLDDPFTGVMSIVENQRLGLTCSAILVDVHGEASSEKRALGHYLDGLVSLVVGTHTHVPTADAHILSKGTAYQTDAGMCGDYDSVIGLRKDLAVERFTRKVRSQPMETADGEATLCGLYLETDDKTGLAKMIKPIMLGGLLGQKNFVIE
jgi:2',3'-cyclic-nucleotide 2'-phosphodiesterase